MTMRKRILALTALALTGGIYGAAAQTWTEWQDPAVNEINRLPMRSTLDAGERLPLDGVWRFDWVRNASERPDGIWRTDYDDSAWATTPRAGNVGTLRLGRPDLCQCGYAWRG